MHTIVVKGHKLLFSSLLKNPLVRFVLIGSLLYLSLYFCYEFYINPHTNLDEWIINNLVSIAESILRLFGYSMTQYDPEPYMDRIGIAGSTGVFIGEPCDGFVLFTLFVAFITAFPGPLKHKLWFVPCGILLIHFINALRIIALVLIMRSHPDWLSFNHDYTFTIIVYSFVFLLWWIWINKFSPLSKNTLTAKS